MSFRARRSLRATGCTIACVLGFGATAMAESALDLRLRYGFDGLNRAFAEPHGFGPGTSAQDFCAAAEREFLEQTGIGTMLKRAK